MPSFVLSLALLLLVALMLLAVSNRELIALTFLGFSTVALPLSIWIVGAIALGFILGLWILLLFRFGAVGLGSGNPAPGRRRSNYGPEDFAVVDERFADGGDRYDDGRYGDNRYDDVYGQGQSQSDVTASQGRYQSYSTDRYPAEEPSSRYAAGEYGESEGDETDRYGRGESDYYGTEQQSYGDRSESAFEPQDRFSAASGYEPSDATSRRDDVQPRNQPVEMSQTMLQQPRSATDPTIPADWDDQYREDWTPEELVAEPVLRNEGAAPKLKRWFSQPSEGGRPKLNLGGFGSGDAGESGTDGRGGGQSTEAERSPAAEGEAADWQGASPQGRYDDSSYDSGNQGRNDVYDADYRVVRQPEEAAEPLPRSAPEPRREAKAEQMPQPQDAKSERPRSEWDIESDLDW